MSLPLGDRPRRRGIYLSADSAELGQAARALAMKVNNLSASDAEKMLAFATGREVRMLLGSPSRIREKLDLHHRSELVRFALETGLLHPK